MAGFVPPPQPPSVSPDPEPDRTTPDDENAMLFCPVCSTRLQNQKCKLFCALCGYYLSCADYY